MLSFLFRSQGAKRQVAAILSVLLGFAEVIPGAAGAISAIQWAAGVFGVTGLVHAAGAQTLLKHRLAGITAVLTTLIAVAHFVPSLAPLIGPMQHLASILGAAAVGSNLSKS
jgi:hypothetical protein